MTTFVDYAWWQVTPAQLAAMGFAGVARYGVPGNTKSITPAELAKLRAAGFDVVLVYETTANRAAQGWQAGHDDAVRANQFDDAIGYPASCLQCYAVDFDADPAQVQPYFDGVAAAGGRPSAPYGGFRVVNGLRYPAPYAWQTVAWSYDYSHSPPRLQISPRAGLLQNGFHDTYDSNRVLVEDFGQWRSHVAPPSPPPPPPWKVIPVGGAHLVYR